MIGLAYGRELKGLTQEEMGNMVGVKRQAINIWEQTAKIPKSRISDFSSILGIPEEYLSKELTEIDKLKLEKMQLEKKLEQTAIQIYVPVLDEKGNVLEDKRTIYKDDNNISDKISTIDNKIMKLQLLDRISTNINNGNLELYLYKSLTDILDNKMINKANIVKIFNALKLSISGDISDDMSVNMIIKAINELDSY